MTQEVGASDNEIEENLDTGASDPKITAETAIHATASNSPKRPSKKIKLDHQDVSLEKKNKAFSIGVNTLHTADRLSVLNRANLYLGKNFTTITIATKAVLSLLRSTASPNRSNIQVFWMHRS